jgi:glycine C-acetyltransferase/8-amino-7-oxononanoate synthase
MADYRFQSPVGPRVWIDGRERDYFSGTGYLCLQNHPAVLQAAAGCIQRYGLSTATSRGGYGEHAIYDEVDGALNCFFGSERNLYYASGYLGAGILVQGLREGYERIFIDESAHFSVFEAAHASGCAVHAFAHCDATDLVEKIRAELQAGERPLVLSDGLFPISGEIAPADALLAVVEAYDGLLALDDAHAAGVLGRQGRGTLEFWQVNSPRCYSSKTLSKALGGYGGVVTGTAGQIDELERLSHVYTAASPPPLPAAAASAAALRIAEQEPERRERLWANVRQARAGLRELAWPELIESPAPILCLGTKPGLDLARIKDALFERGICVAHVKNYSSTPVGGALRVAIFSEHSQEQIARLVAEMAKVC